MIRLDGAFSRGGFSTKLHIAIDGLFETYLTVLRQMSPARVLGFAALSFVMLALSAARPIFDPAGRDLIAIIGIALFGFTTVYWCAVFIAKCWREPA